MAAVAAGSHPAAISTAFLMDPVDWNLESNRVDSQYLTRCSSCHVCFSCAIFTIIKLMVIAIALKYTGLCVFLYVSGLP